MSGRRSFGAGLAAAGLIAAAGCAPTDERGAWPEDAAEPRAEVVVDLAHVRDGRVPVSMRLSGVAGEELVFAAKARNDEYTIHDVHFADGAGRPIPHVEESIRYRLDRFEGDVVEARWEAKPGGWGRHGLQGTIAEDWATFDGRLYVVPTRPGLLRAARIRFVLPRGWVAATPFRQDGGWHYLDTFSPGETAELLDSTCVGMGRFEVRTRQVGGMDVRVAAYAGWDAAHKTRLFESTFGILEYFHESLGFDLRSPYSVVWSPDVGGKRVHGGSHVNGTCLENPQQASRPFQLLAHRVAHSMDKYQPSGMRLARDEHAWFREGWPSYMEVLATEAAGIVADRDHFNALYSLYKETVAATPDHDFPLAEDRAVPNPAIEFMHYRKGPLVAAMLAFRVERSGRTLEEFMRAMWAEHGFGRGRFDLEPELEAFVGASLDDFWEMNVRRKGIAIPVWKGYVTERMRRRLERAPAARVGGTPLAGDYLHYLAASGEFATFGEIRDFLVGEELRRRELVARDVVLYPEEIREALFAIPAEDRYAIARHEALHPLVAAGRPVAASTVRLEFDRDVEDGRAFAELLETEARYTAAVRGGPLSGVVLRTRRGTEQGTPCLAFGPDALVELTPEWRGAPRRTEVDLLVDGQAMRSWVLDPARGPAAKVFLGGHDRPGTGGAVAFRVRAEGAAPVVRAFWQRGKEAGERASRPDPLAVANPSDPDAWYRRGLALIGKGDQALALAAFRQAAELAPDEARHWFKHGEMLVVLGRPAEALESFDRALAIESGFTAAAGQRALALAALGRREEALGGVERLAAGGADAPSVSLWKGRVHERLGDAAGAADAFREYTRAQPTRPQGWQGLGHALVELGRYREALEALDRALVLDPRDERAEQDRNRARRELRGSP